jgi:uncharacterized protein
MGRGQVGCQLARSRCRLPPGDQVFRDTFAVERIDDREDYAEERINLIGMCDGVLVHVTYTERDQRIRIISARRAERHEQDDYYRENSP